MKAKAHGVVWWLECALGTGGVLVDITIPLIGMWNSSRSILQGAGRSTGAAINQGQETATQHDCGAFGKDSFFLPQKRRRNEDQWGIALGSDPLGGTTLISGARCRFQLELRRRSEATTGRLVIFSNQPPYNFSAESSLASGPELGLAAGSRLSVPQINV